MARTTIVEIATNAEHGFMGTLENTAKTARRLCIVLCEAADGQIRRAEIKIKISPSFSSAPIYPLARWHRRASCRCGGLGLLESGNKTCQTDDRAGEQPTCPPS